MLLSGVVTLMRPSASTQDLPVRFDLSSREGARTVGFCAGSDGAVTLAGTDRERIGDRRCKEIQTLHATFTGIGLTTFICSKINATSELDAGTLGSRMAPEPIVTVLPASAVTSTVERVARLKSRTTGSNINEARVLIFDAAAGARSVTAGWSDGTCGPR